MPKSKSSSPSGTGTGAFRWLCLLVVNAGLLFGIYNNATNAKFCNTTSENKYVVGGRHGSNSTTLRGADSNEIVSDAL